MSYFCNPSGSTPHSHLTVEEGRACYEYYATNKAVTIPFVPAKAAPIDRPMSPRQLDYIVVLGGNTKYCEGFTIRQASDYIKQLKASASKRTPPVLASTPSQPVQPPADPGTVAFMQPYRRQYVDARLPMLTMLISMVPDGYYAVRAEEDTPITFIRISRPKTKKFSNCIKVQTQHGDELMNAGAYWINSNQWSLYQSNPNSARSIIDSLLLLVADYRGFAMLYAEKIGKCCRCNASLTDPRSRHNLIGPECETYWPWVLDMVAEKNGDRTYEQLKARGLVE